MLKHKNAFLGISDPNEVRLEFLILIGWKVLGVFFFFSVPRSFLQIDAFCDEVFVERVRKGKKRLISDLGILQFLSYVMSCILFDFVTSREDQKKILDVPKHSFCFFFFLYYQYK